MAGLYGSMRVRLPEEWSQWISAVTRARWRCPTSVRWARRSWLRPMLPWWVAVPWVPWRQTFWSAPESVESPSLTGMLWSSPTSSARPSLTRPMPRPAGPRQWRRRPNSARQTARFRCGDWRSILHGAMPVSLSAATIWSLTPPTTIWPGLP